METVLIDSNIILRFLIRDNVEQHQITQGIFHRIEEKEMKALISIAVVNEVLWVSKTYYKIPRKDFIPKLINIIEFQNIDIIETHKHTVLYILSIMSNIAIDFTDIYLSVISGDREVLSFDKDFYKLQLYVK